VVFEGLYCAFGGVDAVVIWLDELYGAVLFLKEGFDGGTGLVVGDVELWPISFCG
jgi:hypothetical protein